jgi:hypothetical protein
LAFSGKLEMTARDAHRPLRRRFFLLAGCAALLPAARAAAAPAKPASGSEGAPRKPAGYRLTAHIRGFYNSAARL